MNSRKAIETYMESLFTEYVQAETEEESSAISRRVHDMFFILYSIKPRTKWVQELNNVWRKTWVSV